MEQTEEESHEVKSQDEASSPETLVTVTFWDAPENHACHKHSDGNNVHYIPNVCNVTC